MVLNACKLGATAANVSALTQKFALAGVPAAVGMTEEIDERDASEFCNSFYSSLFLELANASAILEKEDECAIDWATLLHGPRMSISDRRAPASIYPHWSFPVMYVGGSDFKLKKHRAAASLAHAMRDGAIQQFIKRSAGCPRDYRERGGQMTVGSLRINAWNPQLNNGGALSSQWYSWTIRERMQRIDRVLAFEDRPDPRNWRCEKIGWGVVLPENESLSLKDRALPVELPAKVQEIVANRKGVVLRHRKDLAPEKIARYYADDGRRQDFRILGSEAGIGVGEMPMYLLILASPEKISWRDQYLMSGDRFVGRLDLPDTALENYFAHLASDWQGSVARPLAPLLWSVDWDGDITSLIRHMVAEPAYATYKSDNTLNPFYLHGASATSGKLMDALRSRRPGVIITTSHGATSPLDDVAALCALVGLPVDQNKKLLDSADLLNAWQPDGAIWYAHACCSAGTDACTSYAGLFDATGDVDRILQGVTQVGSRVAQLPTALLSAEKPARAFVGHVEPTFDWPLQDPETGQPLSLPFSDALTRKLYATYRHPIGSAFREVLLDAVQQRLDANPHAMRQRRETVEHPFGTMKGRMGGDALPHQDAAQGRR